MTEAPEKALDFIRDNAEEAAKARGHRLYLEQYRKTLKANLIVNAPEYLKTGQERESYAYAHPEYKNLLEDYREAVEVDESFKMLMKAAELKVDVWRTSEASNRRVDRTHQ